MASKAAAEAQRPVDGQNSHKKVAREIVSRVN